MTDWNKEIKLSDLFRRKAKADGGENAAVAAPADAADAPKPEKTSLLKREISLFKGRTRPVAAPPETPTTENPSPERASFLKRDLSFRRPKRDPASEPKTPKTPRRERGQKAHAPLPAVPLMRAFNLLPKDDPRQASKRRLSSAQLGIAVAGLVLVAALASFFLIANASVADKQLERDELKAQVAAKMIPAEKRAPTGGDPALADERDRRTAALGTALGARVAWDRVLREFALVVPDDVWLKSITATGGTTDTSADPNAAPSQTSFQVNGYTREQEGVARLLSRMAVLPQLDAVQLVSATKVELGKEEVVEFTISALVKQPAAGGTT